MTDAHEMTDEERIGRAQRARTELGLTEDAFEKVKAALVARMLETTVGTDGDQVRLRCVLAVQNLKAVRQMLFDIAMDGQTVEQALETADLLRPDQED
jgi:hypothetical protein